MMPASVATDSSSKKPTLLLVDDEEVNLQVLKCALEDDYNLLMTKSGEDAVRVIQTHEVDLILLDILMPRMNGYETLAALRTIPSAAQVPVIFVTALQDIASEREGISLGAVDYIVKPFDIRLLMLRVANHVELSRYRHQLEVQVDKRTSEILAMKQAAERESKAKTEFIRHLHDCLKNPLSAVSGFGQLIDSSCSPAECVEYASHITHNAELISSLLKPMLQYAEIDYEAIRDTQEKFAVAELLGEVADLLAFQAKERGITVEILGEKDVSVLSNRYHLRTVCVEILKNAIQYSPRGSTVSIRLNKDHHGLELLCRDCGPGIATEDIESAFLPFNRLGKTLGNDGLGLGLTIVSRILDALDIKYVLERNPDAGMTFSFRFAQV